MATPNRNYGGESHLWNFLIFGPVIIICLASKINFFLLKYPFCHQVSCPFNSADWSSAVELRFFFTGTLSSRGTFSLKCILFFTTKLGTVDGYCISVISENLKPYILRISCSTLLHKLIY